MQYRYLFLAIWFLSTSTAAFAQVRTFTLQEAVQTALSNSIGLRKAQQGLASQNITIEQNAASLLPEVHLGASLNTNFGLSFDNTTGQVGANTTLNGGTSVSSSVPIFSGGLWNPLLPWGKKENPAVTQARQDLTSSQFNLERTKENLIFSVVSSFLDLINNQTQVKILEENLSAQKQQLVRIQQFVRAGSRSTSDELQQQAAIAQAELQLLNTKRAQELSKIRLLQTMQVDPFGQYDFSIPDVNQFKAEFMRYDVDAMIRQAYQSRNDVKAQQSMIESAKLGIDLARRTTGPSLTLSGSAGTNYSSLAQKLIQEGSINPPVAPVYGKKGLFEQVIDNRSLGFSLQFGMPIYDKGQKRRTVQQAQIRYESALLDLANLEQNIATEIRQSYLDYTSADKELATADIQLNYRKQALDLEQNRYNLGASTIYEITQARAAFLEAQLQRSVALYSLVFRKQLLEYYVGRLTANSNILPK